MIDEYGIVRNETNDRFEVEVTTPGACESCPVHDNCYGAGKRVWLPKQDGISPGDRVRFSISNASVLKISALVYGIPLGAVLGGILAGYLWLFRALASDPKTLLSVLVGAGLFLASGFAISRLDPRIRKGLSYSIARADGKPGGPAARTLPEDDSRNGRDTDRN